MSAEKLRVHKRAIDARTQEIIEWFVDQGNTGVIITTEPEEGSPELAYWKAGYLRALRDVRRGKLVLGNTDSDGQSQNSKEG